MPSRSISSPVFSFLACSVLVAGLFFGGSLGERQEALALETIDKDPGVPECVMDSDCGRGQYCDAPEEACAAEPGCRDPQKGTCPETCWGYCKERSEERNTQEIDEGDYCEEVRRLCSNEGDGDLEGCVRQKEPKCAGMMQERSNGGDESRGGGGGMCEEQAERITMECAERAAEAGMDSTFCEEGVQNFLEKCGEGFGQISEEDVRHEGDGGQNATGEIAQILSYAVQLVIQNLSAHPELKDAAQILGGLIVQVAGGDIGSVVPEAVRVLEDVQRILGVSPEQRGEMQGPSPEDVQQHVGPMCEEMGGMLEMIKDEVLPFLAENNVKADVLAEMTKRVTALQGEFEDVWAMCESGNPDVFHAIEAFGMKMEALGEYADKHFKDKKDKKVLEEADELFFAEDPFEDMGPPGMMGPGMGDFGGMDPEKMQMMFQEKEGCYDLSPEEMGPCLNAIDERYDFHPMMMGPPGMMNGPGMGMPPGMEGGFPGDNQWMQEGEFPGEGMMPWDRGEFPGEGREPWMEEGGGMPGGMWEEQQEGFPGQGQPFMGEGDRGYPGFQGGNRERGQEGMMGGYGEMNRGMRPYEGGMSGMQRGGMMMQDCAKLSGDSKTQCEKKNEEMRSSGTMGPGGQGGNMPWQSGGPGMMGPGGSMGPGGNYPMMAPEDRGSMPGQYGGQGMMGPGGYGGMMGSDCSTKTTDADRKKCEEMRSQMMPSGGQWQQGGMGNQGMPGGYSPGGMMGPGGQEGNMPWQSGGQGMMNPGGYQPGGMMGPQSGSPGSMGTQGNYPMMNQGGYQPYQGGYQGTPMPYQGGTGDYHPPSDGYQPYQGGYTSPPPPPDGGTYTPPPSGESPPPPPPPPPSGGEAPPPTQ